MADEKCPPPINAEGLAVPGSVSEESRKTSANIETGPNPSDQQTVEPSTGDQPPVVKGACPSVNSQEHTFPDENKTDLGGPDQVPHSNSGDTVSELTSQSPVISEQHRSNVGDTCPTSKPEGNASGSGLLFATAAESLVHEEELNSESKAESKELLATTQSVTEEDLTEASSFESGEAPYLETGNVSEASSFPEPVTSGAEIKDTVSADVTNKSAKEEQKAGEDDGTAVKRKRRPLPDVNNKEELNAWLASISSDLAKITPCNKDEETKSDTGHQSQSSDIPKPDDAKTTNSQNDNKGSDDIGEPTKKEEPTKTCQDIGNPMEEIAKTLHGIQSQIVIVSSQFINLQYKLKDIQKNVEDLAKTVENHMEKQKQDISNYNELD